MDYPIWSELGAIESLWIRSDKGVPPLAVDECHAVAGEGLVGDCHVSRLSPRQVLLVSDDAYRMHQLEPALLRENITVAGDLRSLSSGTIVALGRNVLLRITFACEPCAKLNTHRAGLMRSVGDDRGVLARVVAGGVLRIGDRIRISPGVLEGWSDRWQERVQKIARSVPIGRIVRNTRLAVLAGVPPAYCRVFPRVLSELPDRVAERVVRTQDSVVAIEWTGEELFKDEDAALDAFVPTQKRWAQHVG